MKMDDLVNIITALDELKQDLFVPEDYKKHLGGILVDRTHNGYFSIDKKSKRMVDPATGKRSTETDDVDAYDLILKDKERLPGYGRQRLADLQVSCIDVRQERVEVLPVVVGVCGVRFDERAGDVAGLQLDERFQAKELPWKLKMSVSGCLNDCAEACIKDIALLGTPKGWRLQVGGNGGSAPRFSQRLLEDIATEEEALAVVERLIDWFAAQNRKCRIGKLVDEVGLDQMRKIALGG